MELSSQAKGTLRFEPEFCIMWDGETSIKPEFCLMWDGETSKRSQRGREVKSSNDDPFSFKLKPTLQP